MGVAGREGAQLLTLAAASSQPSAGRRAPHPPPVTARRWERLKLQQLRRRHSPRALLLLLPLYAITRGMRKGLQEEEERGTSGGEPAPTSEGKRMRKKEKN